MAAWADLCSEQFGGHSSSHEPATVANRSSRAERQDGRGRAPGIIGASFFRQYAKENLGDVGVQHAQPALVGGGSACESEIPVIGGDDDSSLGLRRGSSACVHASPATQLTRAAATLLQKTFWYLARKFFPQQRAIQAQASSDIEQDESQESLGAQIREQGSQDPSLDGEADDSSGSMLVLEHSLLKADNHVKTIAAQAADLCMARHSVLRHKHETLLPA